jgi:peptidoglycan/LPS O-acetylase OafA/YrhL
MLIMMGYMPSGASYHKQGSSSFLKKRTKKLLILEGRSVGLDVVRSVAILMVLVSHYGSYFAGWYGVSLPLQVAAAGFFGVELFFVLSGFLIGRLLIDILDRGATARAWLIFLVRRWMRTLPLYFVCVVLLALFWSPQLWARHHQKLWDIVPWYVALMQNFAWRMVGDWFPVSWSLTVEEWFYLFFSGVLFAVVALLGRRLALGLTLLLFLMVPAALRWGLRDDVDWDQVTSKVVLYRLDAIAFGVVMAWMHVRRMAVARYPGLLLAAGLVIIALFWGGVLDRALAPPAHLRKTFMFDVASIGFALWMPAAAGMRWRPGGALAKAAGALSGQSYAMYLTHLTVIGIVASYRDTWQMPASIAIIMTIALLYGVTWLSFHYLEQPILALRPPQYQDR